jgi:hypothetical protein
MAPHLDELRPRKLQEGGVGLSGAGASDQGLSRARGSVQQDPLWRLDAQGFEAFFVRDWQHNGLHQLLDLLVQAANVRVVLRGLLVNLHMYMAHVTTRSKCSLSSNRRHQVSR